jgi:hypothetical protein
LSALDVIDAGAGTDTLNISDVGAAGAVAFALTTAATVKNVEVLNLITASDDIGDAVTADVSAWTGLQTVNVSIQGTDAPVTLITTKGNVTAATVAGATTSAITDSATTDTLASVTVVESTGLATLTSDALTSVTLKSSTGGATVVAAAATRALTVNLDGVTAGTVTDNEATALTVNATGTKSSGVTLDAPKATAVTVNAAVATTIAALDAAATKTLTVTGAGATTVTAFTDVTALTSIDASGSTGGLTLPAIAAGVAFTGSATADAVTVVATTKAIAMGAGDDKVTLNAVAALGTGGSIDGGEGTDTLVFNTYANAVTASGATTFEATISGFERLELSGVNSAAAAAVNLANLDDINHVTLSATNTETTTISNMGANGTIVFTASQTTAKPVTVSLKDATGTADVLNVGLSKATATALVGLTAAGVETVNVTSTETATTLLGSVTHGVQALVIADATALNISGNAGVTITTLTGTKLTSIDASGVTTGLVSFTTDALAAAATIKGGAGANTITATAATKAVTYTGSDKVDTIVINNAQANVINTGAGNDLVTIGSGAVTVDLGAGDDTLTLATAATQTQSVTLGAGADTVDINAVQASAGAYLSILDFQAGDKIDVAGVDIGTIAGATLGAKVTLGAAANFATYINAIAAGDGETDGAGGAGNSIDGWFQLGGNTYLVIDNSEEATFQDGQDIVIEIVGLVDLTNMTQVAGVYTLA